MHPLSRFARTHPYLWAIGPLAVLSLMSASCSRVDAVLLPKPETIAERTVQPRFSVAEFALVMPGKDVLATVEGKPFAAIDGDLQKTTIDAMDVDNWNYPREIRPDTMLERRIRFTTKPEFETAPDYRIAVFYSLPATVNPELLCNPKSLREATGGVIEYGTVSMAFCRNDAVLSASHARFGEIKSVDDKAFRKVVAYTTREMFPEQMFRDFLQSTRRLPRG